MTAPPHQRGPSALELVVLVGLQGSGKSSFVTRYFKDTHAHVSKDLFPHNRDKPRRQRQLIDDALAAGRSVVVDNTNARREDRVALIAQARVHGARVVCYWIDASVATCIRRNAKRTGRAHVPVVGILATSKRFEPPVADEGFDALYLARLNEETDAFEITPLP